MTTERLNDRQLLDDYAQRRADDAFRVLADRYTGLVYHAALRQVGNPHVAEEVTQAVFIALAHKAGKLPRDVVLSGWLFRATRFAVSNIAREAIRRQNREQEAFIMETLVRADAAESSWGHMAPHLNSALEHLSSRDREAVLIRFFEGKSYRDVAGALGVSEDAAKMRVARSLEKLRLFFSKQGLVLPAAGLLATLSAYGAQAAPAGLSATVAAATLANGSGGTASAFTLANEILKLMVWSKTKIAILSGAALLLTGATTGVLLLQARSRPASLRAARAADRSTPKGSLIAISKAIETGDVQLFFGSINFVSPDDDLVKDTLERLLTTFGEYHRTAIERFGSVSATASFSSLPFKLPAEKLQAAKESIKGDTAEVLFDTREQPIVLTRRDGQWKTTPGGMFHLSAAALNQEGTALISVLQRVGAGIRAGEYATALDAAKAAHGGKK